MRPTLAAGGGPRSAAHAAGAGCALALAEAGLHGLAALASHGNAAGIRLDVRTDTAGTGGHDTSPARLASRTSNR